jgi:hypothetical protein
MGHGVFGSELIVLFERLFVRKIHFVVKIYFYIWIILDGSLYKWRILYLMMLSLLSL